MASGASTCPANGFGLWLDSDQFDRTFTSRMVYFVTPSGRDLVPDFRWFPNGPRLATTLARAQLGRVPDYLENAVVTGVPTNTRLAVNAVPVVGGRAQVSLSSEALSADPDDRTAMWAQLTATLSQVSSVSSVSLAVDDTPLELPSGVSSASSAAELGYDTVTNRTFDTALLRQGDELSRLDPRFLPGHHGGLPSAPTPSPRTATSRASPTRGRGSPCRPTASRWRP